MTTTQDDREVDQVPTPAKWSVERVPAKTRKYGKQRAFVWQVTCPTPPVELSWENDFGRGMHCGCRRFPTEGKANRYAERKEAE